MTFLTLVAFLLVQKRFLYKLLEHTYFTEKINLFKVRSLQLISLNKELAIIIIKVT